LIKYILNKAALCGFIFTKQTENYIYICITYFYHHFFRSEDEKKDFTVDTFGGGIYIGTDKFQLHSTGKV